jgi:hypothetical protein
MVILGIFFYFLIWWVVLAFKISTSRFVLGALLLELFQSLPLCVDKGRI